MSKLDDACDVVRALSASGGAVAARMEDALDAVVAAVRAEDMAIATKAVNKVMRVYADGCCRATARDILARIKNGSVE